MNVIKENTPAIFFKRFRLTKTQKGEKIIHKETMYQQVFILKVFSEKDYHITVRFQTMSHRRGRSHRSHCRDEELRSPKCRTSGHSFG